MFPSSPKPSVLIKTKPSLSLLLILLCFPSDCLISDFGTNQTTSSVNLFGCMVKKHRHRAPPPSLDNHHLKSHPFNMAYMEPLPTHLDVIRFLTVVLPCSRQMSSCLLPRRTVVVAVFAALLGPKIRDWLMIPWKNTLWCLRAITRGVRCSRIFIVILCIVLVIWRQHRDQHGTPFGMIKPCVTFVANMPSMFLSASKKWQF